MNKDSQKKGGEKEDMKQKTEKIKPSLLKAIKREVARAIG